MSIVVSFKPFYEIIIVNEVVFEANIIIIVTTGKYVFPRRLFWQCSITGQYFLHYIFCYNCKCIFGGGYVAQMLRCIPCKTGWDTSVTTSSSIQLNLMRTLWPKMPAIHIEELYWAYFSTTKMMFLLLNYLVAPSSLV